LHPVFGVSDQQYRWSQKSLAELEQLYHNEIAPKWRRAGNDPVHDRPPYEWLADNGFSGLNYALREHHDMTVKEFFVDVLDFSDDADSEGYTWGIDAEETVAQLDKYVRTLSRRRKLADSTVETKRARLAKYVRIYADVHGAAPIVKRVRDRDAQPDEIERALAVFDELDAELDSDDSKLRYYGDVSQFYEHLQRRGVAAYNPVTNFDKEYGWERSEPDNPTLDARQVRALYQAADDREDELIVLALCAWGLRPNEVAALHTGQFVLEGDDPHIAFDERKNGPGTVALLYGRETLEDRLIALGEREDWNGYLFPSSASSSGHIVTDTVGNRFTALAERAGVTVRGATPTAKMGRRFWYTAYTDAVNTLVEQLDEIAADQGSSDASVVASNYLSEDVRREHRREYMRERLAEAFENDGGSR
jgi:integrase